jgi:tetratricopeptide (TPR) repeat protein
LTTTDEPSGEPPLRVVEAGQRLSSSLLWDLQRSFFEQQGESAWSCGLVPQYITSNPWIANAYAQVVLGWLRDGGFDLRHPVYVLELGCGSGRFGYLFLNRLRDLLARSPLAQVRIRYVLTDFHAGTLEALRNHPALQDLLAEGALDFAVYDAFQGAFQGGGAEQEIRLLHSGEVLAPHTLHNPLAVVANYVFDSIPQDAFTVRGGVLFDVRLTVKAPLSEAAEIDRGDPAILDRLELEWVETSAAEAPYGDPELDRLLRESAERLDGTTFLFPCAAIRSLRHLARLADGRLLLLSGDKGYCQEEQLEGLEALGLTIHGSFSFGVNYHALGQWLVHRGGTFLSTTHVSSSLAVVAGLLGEPPGGSIEMRLAFDEAVERTGPDDFFDLKRGLETAAESLTLPQLLAWVRFSGWDAHVLLALFPALMQHARPAPDPLRHEIDRMVQEVWSRHFPVREPGDLPFHLGVLLCEIERYGDALPFFHESLGLYGPNGATLFNVALCLFHLGDLEAARAHLDQTAELAPDYEPAAVLRQEIAAALQSG